MKSNKKDAAASVPAAVTNEEGKERARVPDIEKGAARSVNFAAPSSSDTSETERSESESEGEKQPLLRPVNSSGRRGTVFQQTQIANELSWPMKILGIALAFITIVFLWETTDLLMQKFFVTKPALLQSYLALAIVAAVCLMLSHAWILKAESSLVPSFAYALSTLFSALGTWGIITTSVGILVPKKMQLFCFGLGGVITLFCTVMYTLQTRHNVLLDIASCAITMGMNEEMAGHHKKSMDKAWSGKV